MEQENKKASLLSDEQLTLQMKQRGSGRKLLKFLAYVCGAVMVISFVCKAYVVAVLFVVLGGVCVVFSEKKGNSQKALLGEQVVKTTLAEIFQLEDYRPFGAISADAIRHAGLVSDWDECTGSDYFTGLYRGVRIHFSDVELTAVEKHFHDDGHEETVRITRFTGQWLILETARSIHTPVKLIEKTTLLRKLAKGDILTENEEFNKKFKVFSADAHTAFLVLTPRFMEYISAADQAADGKTLLCFTGNQVHYAINSGRDLFEVGKNTKDATALRTRIRNETKYITDMVDELLENSYLFDNDTGKKSDAYMQF